MEIMIVVAIIGLLAVIAMPSFYSARQRSQEAVCMNNLRQISSAKDQYGIENNLASGIPSLEKDLVGTYLKRMPECPAGGSYLMNDISDEPTCSAYDVATHDASL